jgi:hypothetical protein
MWFRKTGNPGIRTDPVKSPADVSSIVAAQCGEVLLSLSASSIQHSSAHPKLPAD